MIRTTLAEAEGHLRDLVEAALRGEEVVITTSGERGERAIRLIEEHAAPRRGERRFGSLKGILQSAEDLDEPLPDFDKYR
jgi:hypothetical protein